MCRRTVHRWIVALALVATLAGARPAAALDQGFMTGLTDLWSAVTARPAALWESLLGWFAGPEQPSSPLEKADTTWGSDPNGNPVVVTSGASSDGSN